VIVRRGNTGFLEKEPQMIHFVDEATVSLPASSVRSLYVDTRRMKRA
jgi:hypothetical protein